MTIPTDTAPFQAPAAFEPGDGRIPSTAVEPHRALRFAGHISPHVVPGDAVYLMSEDHITALHGRLAPDVVALIDGTRSAAQICAAVENGTRSGAVERLLTGLADRGAIDYADSAAAPTLAGWYHLAGARGTDAADELVRTTVSVSGLGSVTTEEVEAAMARLGVQLVEDDADLRVVVAADYLMPELESVNEAALAGSAPWLLVSMADSTVFVGPLMRPGETGCWRCLADRLGPNRVARDYVRDGASPEFGQPSGARVPARLPGTVELAAQLAAIEVARYVGGRHSTTPVGPTASVYSFDTRTMEGVRHELTRRPQCAACGDSDMQARIGSAPVRVESRPKQFTSDGGHRSSSPAQMIAKYSRHVSPVTGVVTGLQPAGFTPDGVRVYVSGQNLSRHVAGHRQIRLGLRSMSAGKGKTDEQARASAIGEAIERYCGVFRGDEARRRTSLAELGDSAVHPNSVMLFSRAQYDGRSGLTDDGSVSATFRAVPEPFRPTGLMDWSPLWSLTGEHRRWLPTAQLYFNAPNPTRAVTADSNGCAAGTSREDAIMQGFFELVERDAVALWWYNRLRRPAIDLDAFADPYLDRLREVYAGIGRELWALDLTSDFGIPVVGAFSRRIDKPAEDLLIAFGAHFDPAIALSRAVTELNQFIGPATPLPDDPESYAGSDPEQVRWWKTATLANQPHLVADTHSTASRPSTWRDLSSDDLARDVDTVRGVVSDRGMDLLVLDQTRPDVGLPVVRVVVPGMRHFWSRFAPGRLYDVPVAQGWQSARTLERDLNPIPVFI